MAWDPGGEKVSSGGLWGQAQKTEAESCDVCLKLPKDSSSQLEAATYDCWVGARHAAEITSFNVQDSLITSPFYR